MLNKKILIVGGSSGIGYEIARKAIDAGAKVVIASRSIEKLNIAASKLGRNVEVEVVDASSDQSVANLFQKVGSFDHLAITIKPQLPSKQFLENEIDMAMAAFNAKFWGQYRLAKFGVKHINPKGSIVFTSGIASCRSYEGYSVVSAMNAATESLAKSIATELAPIRVNVVCPGFVETNPPTIARVQHIKKISPNIPLDRLATANEIADAYLYLFSSQYSTGTIVTVDGGATC